VIGLIVVMAALAAQPPPSPGPDWQLVWSDEFDGPRIDTVKWQLADDCWGGGNAERQCYTRSRHNAAIEGGHLVIAARRERITGPALPSDRRTADTRQVTRPYSSARLSTRGKAAWLHGRIEVRAMLPQGQGTWPAIWMMPEREAYGPWAASGEIDILEAVNLGVPCAQCPGGREARILGTLHFGGRYPGNRQAGTEHAYPPVLQGFHDYAIEWDANHIVWLVDSVPYAQRSAHEWGTSGSAATGAPFDQPFHLILNLAIGGHLAESRGLGGVAAIGYPKELRIDWVRVWQRSAPPVGTPTRRPDSASGKR
jgi:beta-glucanase (GH16 family)